MKRAEAIKQIASILDKLESSNAFCVQSISIRRTALASGFAYRESFASRIELTISETIEGECIVIGEAQEG